MAPRRLQVNIIVQLVIPCPNAYLANHYSLRITMSRDECALDAHGPILIDRGGNRQTMGDVPRYLFRACSPRSGGVTEEIWVKSADARKGVENQSLDVSARSDVDKAGAMLNRRLRWKYESGEEDFMVSWNSSLLSAL